MILDTDQIKKQTFRHLVIALFASFFYDLFWYMTSQNNAADSLEGPVHTFSTWMSLISIVFRVR